MLPSPIASSLGVEFSHRLKRSRPIKSCVPCRSKKIKCDHCQPCGECHKSNRANECNYLDTQHRQRPRPSSRRATRDYPPLDNTNSTTVSSPAGRSDAGNSVTRGQTNGIQRLEHVQDYIAPTITSPEAQLPTLEEVAVRNKDGHMKYTGLRSSRSLITLVSLASPLAFSTSDLRFKRHN
jgi:hypothetical protein